MVFFSLKDTADHIKMLQGPLLAFEPFVACVYSTAYTKDSFSERSLFYPPPTFCQLLHCFIVTVINILTGTVYEIVVCKQYEALEDVPLGDQPECAPRSTFWSVAVLLFSSLP